MHKYVLVPIIFLFLCGRGESQAEKSSIKSENKVETRILDDSAMFLTTALELAPGARSPLKHDDLDQVIVVVSGQVSIGGRQSSAPAVLSDGEVWFSKKTLDSVISNETEAVAKIVSVGIKKHWDTEVRVCSEPKKCTHPIQIGAGEIGHTTLLFTSGFVTAYRHDLVSGGTLSSSYFSSRGKDYLMLVLLTNVHANFDGQDEDLQIGQAYSSEAAQVEVSAAKEPARWIMLRVEAPKP